jgi:hypothetical protein
MTNRRSAFLAEHLRQPTAEEARQLAEQERADRRDAEAARYEAGLRQAYLATPGATPEQWEKEKPAILAEARKARAVANADAARKAQSRLYRNF